MKKQLLLNRNEVVQGPSPKVRLTIKRFDSRKAPFYFDGYHGSSLRPKLAKHFDIPEKQVSVGYGIEFFLRSIFDALRPENHVVITHEHRYSYYPHYAKVKKIKLVAFKIIDRGTRFEFDIGDCLKKIRLTKPNIIIITSPNNPTGNSVTALDLKKMLRAASRNTLVVLDEAYHGFDPTYDEESFIRLIRAYPNLVILRGFSKQYALAGFRIGFALWGKDAKRLVRYDDPYLGGSRILEEIALAAFDSKPYYRKLMKEIVADRNFFIAGTNRMRFFKAYESKANFVMVKASPLAIPFLEKELKRSLVLISKFTSPELMRVSIGWRKNTKRFLAQMKKAEEKALALQK